MAVEVVLLEAAQQDLQAAVEWYENKQAGLGLAFVDEVDRCLEFLIQHPVMFQEVMPGTRRSLIRRFPYAVYYRPEAERIVIFGVFHSSQSPKKWRQRVRTNSS